jgi:hypothetical protein
MQSPDESTVVRKGINGQNISKNESINTSISFSNKYNYCSNTLQLNHSSEETSKRSSNNTPSKAVSAKPVWHPPGKSSELPSNAKSPHYDFVKTQEESNQSLSTNTKNFIKLLKVNQNDEDKLRKFIDATSNKKELLGKVRSE